MRGEYVITVVIFLVLSFRVCSTFPGETITICDNGNRTVNMSSYGYIESPGYPGDITLNQTVTCLLTLKVENPASVVLTVNGSFDIPTKPDHYGGKRCYYAHRYFWIGNKMGSDTICGNYSDGVEIWTKQTEVVEGPQNIEIGYQHETGRNQVFTAFRFRYEIWRPIDFGGTNQHTEFPGEEEGYIISHLPHNGKPNYRTNINSSLTLTDLIIGSQVEIEIVNQLHGVARYCGDNLQIIGGEPNVRICYYNTTKQMPLITITSSELEFRFTSDERRGSKGFRIRYTVIPPPTTTTTTTTTEKITTTQLIDMVSTASAETGADMMSSSSTDRDVLYIALGSSGGLVVIIAVIIGLVLGKRRRNNSQEDSGSERIASQESQGNIKTNHSIVIASAPQQNQETFDNYERLAVERLNDHAYARPEGMPTNPDHRSGDNYESLAVERMNDHTYERSGVVHTTQCTTDNQYEDMSAHRDDTEYDTVM